MAKSFVLIIKKVKEVRLPFTQTFKINHIGGIHALSSSTSPSTMERKGIWSGFWCFWTFVAT